MIQTLKKDFSRFEEIQILRTVSVEEQKQAPVVKKLDREIKRTLRKKRKESYSITFYIHVGTILNDYQGKSWARLRFPIRSVTFYLAFFIFIGIGGLEVTENSSVDLFEYVLTVGHDR